MLKKSAIWVLGVLLLTGCGADTHTAGVENTTEITTEAVGEVVSEPTPHILTAGAETITAYGQILNNACVYINENHKDKLQGELLKTYEDTALELHEINLKGIDVYASYSDEEREKVLFELEDIEAVLFDTVADGIGIKAELTEAVTTSADKKADLKRAQKQEKITAEPTTEQTERITAGR